MLGKRRIWLLMALGLLFAVFANTSDRALSTEITPNSRDNLVAVTSWQNQSQQQKKFLRGIEIASSNTSTNPQPKPTDTTIKRTAAPIQLSQREEPEYQYQAANGEPFCSVSNGKFQLNGFDISRYPDKPQANNVWRLNIDATNYIRGRTGVPQLIAKSELGQIAKKALSARNGHGYFLSNCMNASYDYGNNCNSGWTQENIHAAAGTGLTWKDAMIRSICSMMSEPRYQGHRHNIQTPQHKYIGVACEYSDNSASCYQEFGIDPKT